MPLGEPTAESCYQVCLRRFSPDTTFVFNLFPQNLPDPALTCSCCKQSIVTIPTPGGQVFATKCRPPLELVDAPKNEIKAKAGDIIKLKYRVANKDKFALSNGGLQLQIPNDVSVSQVISPDGIQYVSSQQSITWWPLYFDKGTSLSFEVKLAINVRTENDVLTVIGGIFVRPLTEGVPTCVGPSSNITVSIYSGKEIGQMMYSLR
jgi:hypothetical protein